MRTFFSSLTLSLLATASGHAQSSPLEKEIARIEPHSGGILGVAAIHLESGKTFFRNADATFPMASTYKVPMAVQAFKLVEEGKLSLDQMITIEPTDVHISEEWAGVFQAPGVSLSLRNIIEPMLIFSENSATDKILAIDGGGGAVTARIKSFGIDGMRVDRSTADLIAGSMGVPDIWTAGKYDKGKWERGIAGVSKARQDSTPAVYLNDPRDQTTPRSMMTLLAKIWRGELLTKDHTSYLLDIMARCETGKARIRGMLPPGTKVAHKTGTFPGTVNDVGIIDLPDGTHVAVALYIKGSTKVEGPDLEATIAQSARAIYDYFLYGN